MTKTAAGSPDGTAVRRYDAGEVYDSEGGYITARLCEVFVSIGAAESVSHPVKSAERQVALPEETKEIQHVGGGYYELPNGERVRGKENALKLLREQ